MKPYLFPQGAAFGRDNLVLHATARRHRVDDYRGPLSIKTVLRGTVGWKLAGREIRIDANSFLVLSDGDVYSMDIDSAAPVTTCCAFFQHGFVERLAHDATTPLEAALDEPERDSPELPFLSRLHGRGPLLEHVQGLAPRCAAELQPSSFEEDFLLLSDGLLRLYEEMNARIARVPAARASTKAELFRRVERAREFMHSEASGPVSLHAAAREACLSPFHFHRAFAAAYQQTPHTYVTALRMARAKEDLARGSSVLETAYGCGFASGPAFTRLFRAHFGVTPSQIRKIG